MIRRIWCSGHQKHAYPSRDEIRAAIRRAHEPGLREYRCDILETFWHMGHLPKPVRQGRIGAAEYYRRLNS